MILALTPGDPDGIGAEIVWKTLKTWVARSKATRLLCVGAEAPFLKLGARVIPVEFSPSGKPKYPVRETRPFVWLLAAQPGGPGQQAGWSIEKATSLVLDRVASGLVTGPISKERLQQGGYDFPGHTEFLAALCANRSKPRRSPTCAPAMTPTMMLANRFLRVSLVTIHRSLKDVPSGVTAEALSRTILHTHEALQKLWRISRPRIAVAALNPHAGEGGQFGTEEIEILRPTVQRLQKRLQSDLSGPFSADTLFARQHLAQPKGLYDAIVCLYHDQGLIPVKLLDFHRTVNVTLGLPIIRTSVDHGVGFDIAGKGIANPSSLRAAIDLAAQFVRRVR